MKYALFSITAGDELFSPQKTLVGISDSPERLSKLKNERQEEREQWLKQFGDQVPECLSGTFIYQDVIEPVGEI